MLPIWYRECERCATGECDYWDEREWEGEPEKVCPKCGAKMKVYREE